MKETMAEALAVGLGVLPVSKTFAKVQFVHRRWANRNVIESLFEKGNTKHVAGFFAWEMRWGILEEGSSG